MNNKVLFIDPSDLIGHIAFNTIYIEALRKQTSTLHIILRESHALSYYDFQSDMYVMKIPEILYPNIKANSLVKRIYEYFRCIYVFSKINSNNYDDILLSHYDEILLSLLPLPKNLSLINHDNARGFSNLIKSFCLKHVSKKVKQIVLENFALEEFKKNKIFNVYRICHGIRKPFNSDSREFYKIVGNNSYKYYLFLPSVATDTYKVKSYFGAEFSKFLSTYNIGVITKTAIEGVDNLIIIPKYLTEVAYESLFLFSSIILVIYPDTFKFRVSAVFYEACANKKKILLNSLPSLEYSREYCNYDPLFSNEDDLINKIKILLPTTELYAYSEEQPDFSAILSKKS